MSRGISKTATAVEITRWLALSEDGARMTTGYPSLEPNERAMAITIRVPRSIFRIPQLKAEVEIGETPAAELEAKVRGLADQLAAGTGLQITVTGPKP